MSLLFELVEEVLVKPLLLLSNESFLECHLELVLARLPHDLIAVRLAHVSLRLLVECVDFLDALHLFLVQSLVDSVKVFPGEVAQNLLLKIVVLVAN